MTTRKKWLVAAATMSIIAWPACGQTDATWTGFGDGSTWGDPLNWDIGVVPMNDGTTYNVFVDTIGDVFFDLDLATMLDDLTLGTGQTLRINAGHSLTILDDAVINGIIDVQNSSFIAAAAGATFGDNQNARLIADGGGTISIAATNYSSAAIGGTSTLFDAHGLGTLIDLSSLQELSAGFNGPGGTQLHHITVAADAVIDLSSVQTLIAPFDIEDRLDITINSDGLVMLPALQETFAAGSGDVRFDINIPSYALLNLLSADDCWFDLAAGTALDVSNMTFFNGRMDIPVGASVTATSLLEINGATIALLPGGTLSAPSATTFTNSFLTVESGQVLTLPSLLNMDNSRFTLLGGTTLSVAATGYSTTGLTGGATLIDAQGGTTLFDGSSITNLNASFNGPGGTQVQTISASAGAMVDLSSIETITNPFDLEDRLDIVVSDTASVPLTSLQTISGIGDTRFLLSVPSYSLPALVDADDTWFDLQAGTALSTPAMTSFGGRMDVRDGASIDAVALTDFSSATVVVEPGGVLNAPNASSFVSSVLTIETGQILTLPVFNVIDNSRFTVTSGQSLTTAAPSYVTTGLSGGATLVNAQGTGTLVDFSSLGSLETNFNGPGGTQVQTITATANAVVDLSGVEALFEPNDTEDRVDITVGSGATIDLALLQTTTGNGVTRFNLSGDGSSLIMSSYATFDQPSQAFVSSNSTISLAGLGVVGSGLFHADDDVSGYPEAIVDGSVRNAITTEANFRTGDLELTMTAAYATFEAASEDIGPTAPAPDSFEFGDLMFVPPLGEGPLPDRIVFVENFDNGNRGALLESVYITGHDGFDGIPALNGGTLLLNGLNVYVVDGGAWIDLQDGLPPVGEVPYKDGFIANRLAATVGDANGDCFVDVTDLLGLLGVWGTANPVYDFDGTGVVDVSDLLTLLGNWGQVCS